ncbi:MAG: hypothetical protein E6J90_11310 [Deltaproteobacteria bacterium]|nr:MAG: hypothetical protein E6J91_19775 [Deltaproteobacteria bacterium]TMQ23082.1 MAG: hypothetical protein E6J90_11310 [Deltaproteobacteria bacterium]
MTLTDLVCAIATVVALCCAPVIRSQHTRCPAGWYVNGIRPTGRFECRRVDLPGVIRGRLHCTNGTHPIVVLTDREARSVGCQR